MDEDIMFILLIALVIRPNANILLFYLFGI
jgi:hypothetical protein